MDKLLINGLGYQFSAGTRHSSPGFNRLDVFFALQPTNMPFDPVAMRVTIPSEEHGMEHLTVRHPWQGDASYPLAADRILLRDRSNRSIQAFTFGTTLMVTADSENSTTVTVESTAPIIEVTEGHALPMILVAEIEHVLTERRALVDVHALEYEHRLAKAEPLMLYAACLNAVRARLGADDSISHARARAVNSLIEAELSALRDEDGFQANIPRLEDIV